jgi:predicted NBD/HSP70 family sugar kinase
MPRGFALSSRPVIAVDLGGTQIRAAVVLPDGTRLARNDRPTPSDRGPRAVVVACRDAARQARMEAPAGVAAEIAGIGVCSPGPVDPASGVILETPNLGPRFRDVPLAAELGASEDLPAFLDRDTNVAALGERAFGAARDCDDFIYLTVSTGVGGSIVSGGQLFHGPDGLAGELGHVPVDPNGPACPCGNTGCVEAIAGDAAILRHVAAATGRDDLDIPAAAELARHGDAGAAAAFSRAGQALGRALAIVANLINPHRIVLSGEGLTASDLFESVARESFYTHAYGQAAECDLLTRPLPEHTWARGAAAVAVQHLFIGPISAR